MPLDKRLTHTMRFRVRYYETDQMGTFYNSRALEWFEVARTELLRVIPDPGGDGCGYARMEANGVLLPLVEAHVEYLGRACYDDELEMTVTGRVSGRARLRFDVEVSHADGAAGEVVRGYTVHAITDRSGRPIRPPEWLLRPFAGTLEEGSDTTRGRSRRITS